jgi:hypothetical protein
VPTVPSNSVVPPLVTARNHEAVPVARAVVGVIGVASAMPSTAPLNAGVPNVSSASSVCDVMGLFALAGRVPS